MAILLFARLSSVLLVTTYTVESRFFVYGSENGCREMELWLMDGGRPAGLVPIHERTATE
jgi:hypothetical protein